MFLSIIKVPAVTGDTAKVKYSALSLLEVPAVTGDTAKVRYSVFKYNKGTGGHRGYR